MSGSEKPPLAGLHLKLGWVWIGLFSALGLVLEALHGFKVGFYLDVGHETRRLMWTLAHTHGTLLGLLHLGFASTLPYVGDQARHVPLASRLLLAAGVLLPGGFFLGGVLIHSSDPGIAIVFVPIGAVALIFASVLIVRSIEKNTSGADISRPPAA